MGKKHQAEQVEVLVSFGGPAPGTNPKHPPLHKNVAPEWEHYYTDDGGIDVAYFNGRDAQTQFNAVRSNTYVYGGIWNNCPDQNAFKNWLAWADTSGGYNGTLPSSPLCPAGTKSPVYNPAPPK